MPPKKKIVIVEDQTIVREGLKSLLGNHQGIEIIGEAADGLNAIRQVITLCPDLVLLDLAMPKMNGISALKEIKTRLPGTKILALTLYKSDEYIIEAFKNGADGYCLKSDSKTELFLAIDTVLAGKKYVSPEISGQVLEGFIEGKQTMKTDSAWEKLTQREKEVLKLVGESHTSREIAEYLCVSVRTVDKHRANIMKKLNLHNAAALTAYAIEKGLVASDPPPVNPEAK